MEVDISDRFLEEEVRFLGRQVDRECCGTLILEENATLLRLDSSYNNKEVELLPRGRNLFGRVLTFLSNSLKSTSTLFPVFFSNASLAELY